MPPPKTGTSSAFNRVDARPGAATSGQSSQPVEARTDKAGHYQIANVPPGRYHFVVSAPGFLKKRTEIEVGPNLGATILIDPELHYSEVV